ncbi:MAG: hypothetical protein RL205_273 [Actinomycetota bacterium]
MTVAIALAAPDLVREQQVMAEAEAHGIEVRRRCVDAADLLGACLGAPGLAAVVTAGLPRLSIEVISRLGDCGSRVIGISDGPTARSTLESLGIEMIVDDADDVPALLAALSAALLVDSPPTGVWTLDVPRAESPPERGRLIAVWGPAGAPGRTTTAIVLSQLLSEHGRTALIDADTVAPSVALHLGLVDDLSGIIVACRHAEAGNLSSRSLESCMSRLSPRHFALTGLAQSRRWPEVRAVALGRVLDRVRSDFSYGVIDIGASLGHGENGQPSPAAAAQAVLSECDVLVAVCRADALGIARFLADLPDVAAHGLPIIGALTAGTEREKAVGLIREGARRLGLSFPIADLSLDQGSLARALRRGMSIRSRRRVSSRSGSAAHLAELVA